MWTQMHSPLAFSNVRAARSDAFKHRVRLKFWARTYFRRKSSRLLTSARRVELIPKSVRVVENRQVYTHILSLHSFCPRC